MIGFISLLTIAAIAFWIGRNSIRRARPEKEDFDHSPIQSAPGSSDRVPMTAMRLFLLLFLSGWIIAWSAGVLTAFVMFVRGFGDGVTTLFLGGWLLAAIAGWALAAHTIYKIVTGQPVKLRGGQVY